MKIIDAQIHIWAQTVTPPSGLHALAVSGCQGVDDALWPRLHLGAPGSAAGDTRPGKARPAGSRFAPMVNWPSAVRVQRP